jgi:hypothetical protein
MFKLITFIVLLISSNVCLSVDAEIYEGIWQSGDLDYYNIQIKDNQIVFIDLSAIESTGSTLESAYIGNVDDFVMNRISSVQGGINALGLVFESPTAGYFSVICDVCDVLAIEIRKIF